MRWLAALVIALFVSSSAGAAEAQAFKPRGGSKTVKKAPTKKKAKAAPKKKAPKKSRAAKAAPKEEAPEDADDYVLIEDDDA